MQTKIKIYMQKQIKGRAILIAYLVLSSHRDGIAWKWRGLTWAAFAPTATLS